MKANQALTFNLVLIILVLLGAWYVFAGVSTVTLISPADVANTSNNDVVFECSGVPDGLEAIRNISVGLNNTGNATDQLILNNTNTTLVANASNLTVANLEDGRFVWNCLAANNSAIMVRNSSTFITVSPNGNATVGANFSRTANRTIIVDTTGPYNITLVLPNRSVSGGNFTSANFVNGTVTVTWSVMDALMSRSVCNVTVNDVIRTTNIEGNSTGTTVAMVPVNFTSSVRGFSALISNNTVNITCTDHLGNRNASENSTSMLTGIAIVDTVRPYEVGPMTFKGTVDGRADVDAVKFDYGSKIKILGCNGTENVDYFNSNATIDIKLPGSTGFKRLVNGTSGVSSFVFDDTQDLGTYEVNCTYIDGSGNGNSTVKKFEILKSFRKSNVLVASEDYRQPISAGSRRDFGEISTGGIKTRVSDSGAFLFQMNGEPHEVLIDEIKDDQITVIVKSDPITAVVKVGEAKSFDVDKDGTNDIEVKLDAITSSGRADITFTRVSTPAPLAEVPPVPPTGQPRPSQFVETVKEEAGTLLTILVVIFVVLLVIYLFLRFKKGKSSRVQFSKRDLGAYRDTTLQLYYK